MLFGTYPPPFGGVSSHINDLAPLLTNSALYNVMVFTPFAKENLDLDINSGFSVIKRNSSSIFKKRFFKVLIQLFLSIRFLKYLNFKHLLRLITVSYELKTLIKKNNIDILITYEENILILPVLKKHS